MRTVSGRSTLCRDLLEKNREEIKSQQQTVAHAGFMLVSEQGAAIEVEETVFPSCRRGGTNLTEETFHTSLSELKVSPELENAISFICSLTTVI